MSPLFSVVLVCALTTLCNGIEVSVFRNTSSSFIPKIVGGFSADRWEVPYQISYQVLSHEGYHHVCGGSILSPYWVVTAGHCLMSNPSSTRVVAGLLRQREHHPENQIVEVEQEISHPQYPGDVAPFDIALLKLKTPLHFNHAVQPISIPSTCERESGTALLTGWGYLTSARPGVAPVLQKISLPLLTHAQCKKNIVRIGLSSTVLTPTMICAGQFTGDDGVCSGDSGGPMVQKGKLIGVASWTCQPCGSRHCPSVYTKVCEYKNFIQEHVADVKWD